MISLTPDLRRDLDSVRRCGVYGPPGQVTIEMVAQKALRLGVLKRLSTEANLVAKRRREAKESEAG